MDRTFQDLTGIDKPFGGNVLIMGGDFRQVVPVIPRAGRTQVVEASLNRSFLWSRHVCVLTLHQNMRVQRMILQEGDHTSAAGQQEFSNWLKRIGEGTEKIYPQHGSHAIHIPSHMCIGCRHQDTVSTLIDSIYGDLNNIWDWDDRAQYIMERGILTPLNEDVDAINIEISSTFLKNNDGSSITIQKYFSADSILEHERNAMYPTEYLNKLNLSGIPPHSLDLFVGCPIILLKNMTGRLANYHKVDGSLDRSKGYYRTFQESNCSYSKNKSHSSKSRKNAIYIAKETVSSTPCICDDNKQIPGPDFQANWSLH